ncbi:HD-GYP domain-containing protein [Echinimonas agarilytica]|uniref:HD-GYP domain-containing protein n=2 Tax=Echinimonas agarilytica TaxID=1215918 RepID=A0AA42B633_9GAMM|nr:HD-GYP domain-containing protein [Echinimonas agarilytica]
MYITEIVECTDNFKLKKPGWASSESSIQQLTERGVLRLNIDTERTITSKPEAPQLRAYQQQTRYDQINPVSVAQEIDKAKVLYSQAKQLQKRSFDDLEQGHNLDVSAFKELSEGLIDSVFRNPQALTMMTRIRQKDEYLLEHSLNVGILLGVFGRFLRLDESTISDLVLGGLLHDIGKIRIPEAILNKPARLTSEEFQVIKQHVLHGQSIITESDVKLPDITVQVMIQHHEQLNGAGYPHHLTSADISPYGRMASIVDIFDALTGERVYKKAMLPTAALSIIRSMTPEKLDSDLVDSFIRCVHVYPMGTLVQLKSGRLGIVSELNEKMPTKPIVKLIYSAKHNRHIKVEFLNLAHATANDSIISAEKAETFGLDLSNYI